MLSDSGDLSLVFDRDVVLFENVCNFGNRHAIGAVSIGVVDVGTAAVPQFEAEEVAFSGRAKTLKIGFIIVVAVETESVVVDDLESDGKHCFGRVDIEVDSVELAVEPLWLIEMRNSDARAEEIVTFVESWILCDRGLWRGSEETNSRVDDVRADNQEENDSADDTGDRCLISCNVTRSAIEFEEV